MHLKCPSHHKKCHIPDLNLVQASLVVLIHVDVDGEMCVDVSHLVFVTLGDTDDQVVDESSDGSESGDVLAGTVVQFDVDNILLGVREVDSQVLKILDEFSCPPTLDSCPGSFLARALRTSWTLDRNNTGLDADLDYNAKASQRSVLL